MLLIMLFVPIDAIRAAMPNARRIPRSIDVKLAASAMRSTMNHRLMLERG
jgi:hypothetical protein